MSDFNKYLGKPYNEGLQDCYQICREYYDQEWGIKLPNYARPHHFWEDPQLDLYAMYADNGFEPVFDQRPRVGDAFLIPILSRINNHVAMYVEDNKVLHHLVNQLSCIEPYRPKWSNRVSIHLRHPDIQPPQMEQAHLHEVMNANILRDPRVQASIARQLGSED